MRRADDRRFQGVTAKSDDPVLYDRESRTYIASRYRPREHAARVIDRLDFCSSGQVVAIRGFGCGYRLQRVLRSLDAKGRLILIESVPGLMKASLSLQDWKEVLTDRRLIVVTPETIDRPLAVPLLRFRTLIHEDGAVYPPGLSREYQDLFSRFINGINRQLNNEMTYYGFFRLWQYNFLRNLVRFYSRGAVPSPWPRPRKPVLIAAPGASLTSQISSLRKYASSCYLIALAPAVDYLLSHDVVPDMVIALDAAYWTYVHLRRSRLKETALAVPLTINPLVTNRWKGPIFFFNHGTFFEERLLPDVFPRVGQVPTVAASALLLAEQLTAGPIGVCGLDLAYYDRTHVKGSAHEYHKWRTTTRLSPLAQRQYEATTAARLESVTVHTDTNGLSCRMDAKLSLFFDWFADHAVNRQSPVYGLHLAGKPKPFFPSLSWEEFVQLPLIKPVDDCLSHTPPPAEEIRAGLRHYRDQCVRFADTVNRETLRLTNDDFDEILKGWCYFDIADPPAEDGEDRLLRVRQSLYYSAKLLATALERVLPAASPPV